MDTPWNESATLTRAVSRPGTDEPTREILFEGPLHRVIDKIAGMSPDARTGFSISLPDRQVRPHTYDAHALRALIDDPFRPRG